MASQQKFIVKLPAGYSSDTKSRIGQDIIQFIVARTQKGLDKDNSTFASYTKDYAEFKDVSKSNVDLTLTGEMLEKLQLLEIVGNNLYIGYPSGDPINDKVEGNVLGTYGQADPISGKARNFLGLIDKDLQFILKAYELDDRLDNTLDSLAEDFINNADEDIINSLRSEARRRTFEARASRLRREQ